MVTRTKGYLAGLAFTPRGRGLFFLFPAPTAKGQDAASGQAPPGVPP